MSQKVIEALVKLFGGDEERATAFLDDVGRVNREIDDEGLIARSAEDETEEEITDDENVESREGEPEVLEGGDPEAAPEIELDDEAMRAIVKKFNGALEPLRERLGEMGEAIETLAQTVEDQESRVADMAKDVKARLAELEKDEEEKRQEYLDDMPRRRKIKVTHRPRQVRGAVDGHDEPQETSLESEANKTLASMPSLGRG